LTRSVAIVGSNGKTGRAVAAALMAAGVEVRGVRRTTANLHTGEGLVDAFAGSSAVYHLAPNLHPLEVLIAANVIAAAKYSGVEKIVFHSVLQPQISAMPHHIAKSKAEELVINSGLDWAILQPSAYAQNLNVSVVGALPYRPSAPFSFVDLRDVALAAVRLLTDEITTFGTFEASGPVTSVDEVSAALGWQCAETGLEHWRESNVTLPKYQFDALTAMFTYYNEHGLVGSSFTLTELLGREPLHAVAALRR
jgi:NAD(P)H dehydrogenase (quinone)